MVGLYLLYALIGVIFHFETESDVQKNVRNNKPLLYLLVFCIDTLLWPFVILFFNKRRS